MPETKFTTRVFLPEYIYQQLEELRDQEKRNGNRRCSLPQIAIEVLTGKRPPLKAEE